MFYKQIVLSCHQFLSMEQVGNSWTQGIPLQPVSDPPLPPSPAPSNASSAASLLYCYEPMVPIGLFEYEEQTGVSPCSSPIANRLTPPTSPTNNPRIKVVSELVYCRYRAVLARFGTDSAYQYMNLPRVKMLGGLPVPPVTTKILFCKKTFRDINLERKLDYCKCTCVLSHKNMSIELKNICQPPMCLMVVIMLMEFMCVVIAFSSSCE